MADIKDILLESKPELSEEDLLRYLDEKTPEHEKYEIEKKMVDTSFESDALEGLQTLNNPAELQKHVRQLKRQLHRNLGRKKQRYQSQKIKNFQWVVLAILLLLFISLIGYGLIAMF
jgi:nitrate/nitrite-specific signal transduction histidine kinase